ncbi:MAG: hypothetical protein P8X96_24390 [Desulfobacteraceae bacterium]
MTDITIPIWLFAVSAGIPCLSFLGLLLFFLRKIRKPYKDMLSEDPIQSKETPRSQNGPFHLDLLSMQIDAVFNGLNAIIETERIKINTLLNNSVALGSDAVHLQPSQLHRTKAQVPGKNNKEIPDLDEDIADLADAGGQPEEIADEMGLSMAEVELALKMRANRQRSQQRRLEAVA